MIPSGKQGYSSHMWAWLHSTVILEEGEKYLWIGPFDMDFVSEEDGIAAISKVGVHAL